MSYTEEINNGLPPLKKGDRGFQTNGFYLPYNPDLKKRSQELRNNITQAENKLRYKFLRGKDFNTARQKIINNYIVDFYIASKRLVIEIDGDTHRSEEEIKYDKRRTKELEEYGLKVIRFTNNEVYDNFEEVCNRIEDVIEKQKIKTPNPLSNKGGNHEDDQKLSNKESDYGNDQKEKSIVPINNAFNPQFYNLKKTFSNLELFRRIDDTGFLPKILEKLGY
ncbi:MAG TPA: endonuclease domain-containing protein, partial [Candidatus Absconditabacterales bacterium]|nr:endonuclease domain-containing protein [Candidatus Absconditabacterales bacterium]